MVRQRSEVGLETVNVMKGDRRKWYVVGSPREWCSRTTNSPVLISLGKMNIITRFMNQILRKDVTLFITPTHDRSQVPATAQL